MTKIPILPKELLERCSETFQPTTLFDFVGDNSDARGSGARVIARQFVNMMAVANANGRNSQCILLTGLSGLGKSLLCKFLSHLAGCNKFNTTRKNGTALKVDTLDDIERQLAMTNLFGDWRMLWVDEGDAVPSVAQIRLLTLLDELPPGVIVLFTSNNNLRNFEDRFQSRFQAFRVNRPETVEIAALLERFAPGDPNCYPIADLAGGNVRQALKDLKGYLESADQPMLAAA
jgi:DNA polymerase III delta prime subunit